MVQLRPYQKQAVSSFFSGIEEGRFTRGLCVSATGTGKSLVMAKAIHEQRKRDLQTHGKHRPIVFLAHRTELLAQMQKTLLGVMPHLNVQIEQGGQKSSPTSDIVIASVQTVGPVKKSDEGWKRIPWLESRGGASLLCIDEVHHASSGGYIDFAERLGVFSDECNTVGMTATPQRMDKKAICKSDGTAILQEEFFRYGLLDAIKDGYLAPIKGKIIVTNADLSNVKTRGGDYVPEALEAAVDTQERNEIAFKHWKEEAGDRLTIGFCTGIDHARHACEYWQQQGINAGYVTGDVRMATERQRVLRNFALGSIRIVFNCEVLTEGYDNPPVSCVLMLRPTKSATLYAQCVGRCTRLFGGDDNHPVKDYGLVLDCTDNSLNHRLDEKDSPVTLSVLAGLPAGIDLEGEDILSAKEAWDQAEEGGTETSKVKSLSGLKTAAKAIDLLGEAQLAPEVKSHSTLAWSKIGQGYIITAPPRQAGQGKRVARLYCDTLGNWKLQVGDAMAGSIAGDSKGFPEFASADTAILSAWPDARGVLSARSAWRQDAPTEKQVARLKMLGVPELQISRMTKGDASQLMYRLASGGIQGFRAAQREIAGRK